MTGAVPTFSFRVLFVAPFDRTAAEAVAGADVVGIVVGFGRTFGNKRRRTVGRCAAGG